MVQFILIFPKIIGQNVTHLSVPVNDTLSEVEVCAGSAVVAQLLLGLDDPQQPVDDIVVQLAGGSRCRLLWLSRRLCVRPQVPGVPRPAVPYGRTLSVTTGGRVLQQHQSRGHHRGCACGRHGVSVDRCYRGGDSGQRIELRCPPTRRLLTPVVETHEKSHITTGRNIYSIHDVHNGMESCFSQFVGKKKKKDIIWAAVELKLILQFFLSY